MEIKFKSKKDKAFLIFSIFWAINALSAFLMQWKFLKEFNNLDSYQSIIYLLIFIIERTLPLVAVIFFFSKKRIGWFLMFFTIFILIITRLHSLISDFVDRQIFFQAAESISKTLHDFADYRQVTYVLLSAGIFDVLIYVLCLIFICLKKIRNIFFIEKLTLIKRLAIYVVIAVVLWLFTPQYLAGSYSDFRSIAYKQEYRKEYKARQKQIEVEELKL